MRIHFLPLISLNNSMFSTYFGHAGSNDNQTSIRALDTAAPLDSFDDLHDIDWVPGGLLTFY
jgi:hypothetical protein